MKLNDGIGWGYGNFVCNSKTQSVSTGVNLLWAYLTIGMVKVMMDFAKQTDMAPTGLFESFVLFFTFYLIGLPIFKISVGKNWARITFFVLSVIGMLPFIPILFDEFSQSSFVGALSVAQIGLLVHSLFLLFTRPRSSWFSKSV